MATMLPPIKGAAYTFYVSLLARSNMATFKTAPTLATGDVKVTKDGGTLTNITTLPTVTPSGSALVKVDLSASEMDADIVCVIFQDASGAEWADLTHVIHTYTP